MKISRCVLPVTLLILVYYFHCCLREPYDFVGVTRETVVGFVIGLTVFDDADKDKLNIVNYISRGG